MTVMPLSPQPLIRALRKRGDEAQLTQVIAAIAQAEPEFARSFVEALLAEAAKSRGAENIGELGEVPQQLVARAEVSLQEADEKLGRVDLRFDGEPDFTLFVENKLHSGFGHEQVDRYLRALAALPPDRERRALIAVTRDVPGYGEPPEGTERWLGSVRWATLLPVLRDLPLSEPLSTQWRTLLEILDEDGDLGMTTVNTDLIESWAQFRSARDLLESLLLQVRDPGLQVLQAEIGERFPDTPVDKLAAHHGFGKYDKVPVKHELTRSWLGYRVPASEKKDPGILIQFSNYFKVPHFTVQAEPFDAAELLGDDPKFKQASAALKAEGFESNGHYWARVHQAEEWLNADDVPEVLAKLAAEDIRAIVRSGILDRDMTDAGARRGVLGRWRRAAVGATS